MILKNRWKLFCHILRMLLDSAPQSLQRLTEDILPCCPQRISLSSNLPTRKNLDHGWWQERLPTVLEGYHRRSDGSNMQITHNSGRSTWTNSSCLQLSLLTSSKRPCSGLNPYLCHINLTLLLENLPDIARKSFNDAMVDAIFLKWPVYFIIVISAQHLVFDEHCCWLNIYKWIVDAFNAYWARNSRMGYIRKYTILTAQMVAMI